LTKNLELVIRFFVYQTINKVQLSKVMHKNHFIPII
jgi:hypothetical protein